MPEKGSLGLEREEEKDLEVRGLWGLRDGSIACVLFLVLHMGLCVVMVAAATP